MNTMLKSISVFCERNKIKITSFTSRIVKIRSFSGDEHNLATFIFNYIKPYVQKKKLYIKKIKNNIILLIGNKNNFSTPAILFDAHTDTVPAENFSQWYYPPFSGKIVDGKIYGRGSCDDKSSVSALVFTAMFLAENDYNGPTIAFSLSSNEENSSGKGIEEVLRFVTPRYCVICEPSDLNIVYGHKGKWSVKLVFHGKPAHASLPSLGKNAVHIAYPVMKNILENKNRNFIPSDLGEPVYTICYIESKTNSLNSIPHECSLYIDYRSVLGETEKTVKEFLIKNISTRNYKFFPLHRFFSAWILDTNSQLLSITKQTYRDCFGKNPKLLLWHFCTNGSITMAEHKIPTIGFGPGNPYLAHSDNEYVKVNDIIQAIKFYTLLCYRFVNM